MTRRAAVGQPGVPPVSERELQAAVIDLARSLGWGVTKPAAERMAEEARSYGLEPPPLDGLIYHPRYSLGSEPGWPDLTLIRRRDRRLVFAELKTEKGVLSARQREVLDLLACLMVERPEIPEDLPMPRPRSYLDGVIEGMTKATPASVSVHVWRPADLASGAIAEVLR